MGSSARRGRTDGPVVRDETLTRVALTSISEIAKDAQRAPSVRTGFSMLYMRVCPESLQEIASFAPKFGESGGLKNRCRFERKSQIPQVLISRTLSVCGEVAERLKAAVC